LVNAVSWDGWGCLSTLVIGVFCWWMMAYVLVEKGFFNDFWRTFWLFPLVLAGVILVMFGVVWLSVTVWSAVMRPVRKWWRGVVAAEMESRRTE